MAAGNSLQTGPAADGEDPGPQAGPGHLRQGQAYHRDHRPPHSNSSESATLGKEFRSVVEGVLTSGAITCNPDACDVL